MESNHTCLSADRSPRLLTVSTDPVSQRASHPQQIEAARSRQTCLRQAGQRPLPHHQRGPRAVCCR